LNSINNNELVPNIDNNILFKWSTMPSWIIISFQINFPVLTLWLIPIVCNIIICQSLSFICDFSRIYIVTKCN
jgi:hypothetical protein